MVNRNLSDDIFEVSKTQYKDFVDGIKPGCGNLVDKKNGGYIAHQIYSKKTGLLLCERRAYDRTQTEKYYIFDTPDADETREVVRHPVYTITDAKEFQKILDYLAQKRKEEEAKNGGAIS